MMERKLFKSSLEIPYMDYEREGISSKRYLGFSNFNREQTETNHIFNDELLFQYFSRGRSSVKVVFESAVNGNIYEMFLKDFQNVVNNMSLVGDCISGDFCFRKQGANYGVVLLKD